MNTDFNEEQVELRTTLRRFLEEQAPLSYVRKLWDDPKGTSPEVWSNLAELGLLGLFIPEEHGGIDAGMLEAGIVLEEMGRLVHPGPYLSSAIGATSAAVSLGAEKLLPQLADGSLVATLALQDQQTAFIDWDKPTAQAANGKVTGTKLHVSDAMAANHFFVTTNDGIYLVNADASGVKIEATPTIDGTRSFGTVTFKQADGERLGDVSQLTTAVDRLVLGQALDGLGAAQAALDIALQYAKDREQFGQPIGAFQAVAHLCAGMLQHIELGRSGAYYALWANDNAAPDEQHRSAVMAKAYASSAYTKVGADAIQIFGGAGFSWEFDAHLYYKRLLTLEQTWGGAAEWLEELATLTI